MFYIVMFKIASVSNSRKCIWQDVVLSNVLDIKSHKSEQKHDRYQLCNKRYF